MPLVPPPHDASVRRVRVTSSRRAVRASARRPLVAELSEQTELGEVYLRGLIRAQLRLAATILGIGVAGLGGLPMIFWLFPVTRDFRVLDLPVPWIIVGAAIYPAAVLLAAAYVRRSTRIESDFTEMVKKLS